jgi:cell division inhibitor SepF
MSFIELLKGRAELQDKEKPDSNATNNYDARLIKNGAKPPQDAAKEKYISAFSPQTVSDAQTVIDSIKKGEGMVINLAETPHVYAQRILDYCSGAVYALAGSVSRIDTYKYIFTPKDIKFGSSNT